MAPLEILMQLLLAGIDSACNLRVNSFLEPQGSPVMTDRHAFADASIAEGLSELDYLDQ